jgi:serine/threonine protein kinase
LQPSNILIAHDNNVRLADFGAVEFELSPAAAKLGRLEGGTLPYLAPEILARMPGVEGARDGLVLARDAYAYAITMWEGFARQKPFRLDAKAVGTAAAITPHSSAAGFRELVERGDRPPLAALPSAVGPSHIEQLVCQCWHKEPERRLTFARVCELFGELPHIPDVPCGTF